MFREGPVRRWIRERLRTQEAKLRLKWVKDSAHIYWTSTANFIHSLYYDEETKSYVWYMHELKDFEKLKKDILYPPIYLYEEFEVKDIEEAKRYVERTLYKDELASEHPELVDELVKAREKAYKELKRLARQFRY